jgi:alpha-galactosidase
MPRPKICFIGAGSLGFTRGLVRDLLTFPLMRDAHIALMDIDPERLSFAKQAVEKIIELGKYPATIEATLDRKQALKGADAVLTTILVGDTSVWRHDIEIPKKYGVDFNVGDTRGVAGIFRALRTIPVLLDICRDIENLCPNAILLNYTNPMAMNCKAMQSQTSVKVTGLCHSVQGTAAMLASWIGLKYEEVDYLCAGINHQAWFLEFKKGHKDLYPELRKAVQKKEIYNREIVRNEMFLHLGYYVTESSGHNSEYNWWFRKRPDLIKKYCTGGKNWNPGEHAFILKHYLKTEKTWKKQVKQWLESKEPIPLQRGGEYAAYIINAYLGGEIYRFNGNVLNKGLIDNLPQNACVEVPVFVDRKGFHPVHVGPLPPQLAALNNINIASEEMAVAGCLNGDPEMVFWAVAYDPLSAAVLSLAEIRKMVRELFIKNKNYLPTFKNIRL